jgi:hypothetical protein
MWNVNKGNYAFLELNWRIIISSANFKDSSRSSIVYWIISTRNIEGFRVNRNSREQIRISTAESAANTDTQPP